MIQRYTQLVRSFHRTCQHMIKKKPTPGAGRQLKAMETPEEFINDPEGFGDFESDFMHLDKTHRQHESEQQLQRDHIRHMIVKRKYFNEQKLPSLLLFAEKNEIRNLHARDPEEWTVEKLAESFPTTKEVIGKILKSKWRPYSIKHMRKHDEAVIQNWENLKNGKDCEHIPAELRAHFLKFSTRTVRNVAAADDNKAANPFLVKLPTPAGKEFSSIITSCKQYATDNHVKDKKLTAEHRATENNSKFQPNIDPSDETYLIDKVTGKRRTRLQDFQRFNDKFGNNLNVTNDVSLKTTSDDKAPHFQNPTDMGFIQKFESSEIVVSAEDTKKYEMTTYKDKIYIPRKLWRKGGTYRVDDCYYDDDGEFLYRVPGMSGENKVP